MKRFSTYGTVMSVRLENRNGDSTDCGGNDEALPLVALINYENRIDAERVSRYAHNKNKRRRSPRNSHV